MLTADEDIVVVTGFGLFRDHTLNPSWEAIKEGRLAIDRDVTVITRQIPVRYKEAERAVSELWAEFRPMLMIHVGLAAHENCIRIEKCARLGPYLHDDMVQDAPHKELRLYADNQSYDTAKPAPAGRANFTCKPCQFDTIRTLLDVETVCQRLNEKHKKGQLPIGFKSSEDAGLYVCEYLYRSSLKISPRTVFIHVPNVGTFTLDQINVCLKSAVEELIDELNQL